MRANDIHMGAAIDEKNRVILVTGCIDRNDHTIILKVPVPSNGEWTVIKAEVNITDEPWIAWQINLGEGTTIVEKDKQPELLMSKNFNNSRYLRDKNTVVFYSGGEDKDKSEVRPGDAILKYVKVNIENKIFTGSHNRLTSRHGASNFINTMLTNGDFGKQFPKIEIIAPVTKINEPDKNF
ncbi:DUF6423 family protein [Priestia sp. P5]|uniref:DUF6423 family protein n=1 Tax=Priestia sp. P5 TaxID=2917806 RepID=UPI00240494DD|nr:DUF6423 family protein [Priestia sp. P5]MDG0059144.1 DUF6423 family protein [Priestia sp. P5]